MTDPIHTTHTGELTARYGTSFTEGLAMTTQAVAAGDWKQAASLADQFRSGGRHLYTAVVRDALAAKVDWFTFSDLFLIHPQAAYEKYRQFAEGLPSPAQQRPELAVLLTAGLAAEHDWNDTYGIDLDDLGARHSLNLDPAVIEIRKAAEVLGEDLWIAVRLPAEYEGDGQADEDQVVKQWTTVALAAEELVWLKEALQLNATEQHEDDDPDLDPLD